MYRHNHGNMRRENSFCACDRSTSRARRLTAEGKGDEGAADRCRHALPHRIRQLGHILDVRPAQHAARVSCCRSSLVGCSATVVILLSMK